MLSMCLAMAISQIPADAPTVPALTPERTEAPLTPVPARPPEDPRKWTRILLSSGAGLAGAGIGLGLSVFFADARSRLSPSGGEFDSVFGTAALSGILIAGLGFLVHQAVGGRGEPSLAGLASVGCMLLSALIIGAIPFDQRTGIFIVTAMGALPAAISVTAILEATGAMSKGRVVAW